MPSDSGNDLLWLAFRYVAGEMDVEESAAFEARLSHDQSAREAVAEAVELAGAVMLAAPSRSDVLPIRRRSRRVLPWLAAAAAACLAIVVGYHSLPRSTVGPPPSRLKVAEVNGSNSAVALAWSGLFEGEDDAPLAHTEVLAWLDDTTNADEIDLSLFGASEMEESGLPPWMMEAASLRRDVQRSGSPSKEN